MEGKTESLQVPKNPVVQEVRMEVGSGEHQIFLSNELISKRTYSLTQTRNERNKNFEYGMTEFAL